MPTTSAGPGEVLAVSDIKLLSQATGYGILIGLGVLFALVILTAVRVQKLFLNEDSEKSEMFMVANRSVGTGLTASAVFSSWMWINETVFSSAMCYNYGIAAPMWFGTGLSFQIAFMAAMGVLAKIRVPFAHTSLEIIRRRYGKYGHFLFTVLNLVNNIFGCAGMILAASQLVVGVTGIHIAAATCLIPIGVILYTAVGGLKATFLTDFLHTTIALILIIWFTLSILTSEHIGGLYGLYDKVLASEQGNWIEGNYLGSLLTFKSKGAFLFGLVLKFGNLALVFMDTAFWQKSFASEVHATVPGYNLAALAIFAVPWGIGTVIGLSARVIEYLPIFPTYPNGLSSAQIGAGFVMPYTIHAILGTGGSVGMLLLLFMSVTSTVSSSMIAVSSIVSFDIYHTYINPKASDKQVVRISHLGVIGHGIFITGIALILNYGGANMTWLLYFSPILTCPGIFPLILTLAWKRQSRAAAIIAPLLGLITGFGLWIGTAYRMFGEITMETTLQQEPALYGSIGSLFSPILYSVLISYIKPEVFDFREFLRIDLVDDHDSSSETDTASPAPASSAISSSSTSDIGAEKSALANNEKTPEVTVVSGEARGPIPIDEVTHPFDAATLAYLHRWLKLAWIFLAFICVTTFIVWPLPLYRDYIFTKAFFSGWVTVAIAWQFFAFGAVVVFPVYDGRKDLRASAVGIWKSARGRFAGK